MRLLLVGAGYVGNKILNSWKSTEDCFIATTTTPSKVTEIESSALVEKAILLDAQKAENFFKLNVNYGVIILTVAPKNRSSYKEILVNIALSIKETLKKNNRPVFLLYTSSTSVYGSCEGNLVTEITPLNANSEKGKALIKAEENFTILQFRFC